MNRSDIRRKSPVDDVLRFAVAIGATLVVLIPAARGYSAVGWLPLWLLGMPLCAWACLRLAARLDAAAGHAAPATRVPPRPAVLRRLPAAQPAYRRRRVPTRRRRDARTA
ncbi:hypothetical protein LY625_05495 [Lysobacter sp. GX 14042]|uniref:hypothetical protein n=1 Tax=Lysobacter sp. GX 14042 TaxID=2907155 RepID=UPI001F263385|nr:hypothetical protein [Lysobacter sp. GX 14042]MCE7032075.1 hypothetical protein [Lysobacter sp. GX 14042]